MKIDAVQVAIPVVTLVAGAFAMWLISSVGTGVDATADARTKVIVEEMLTDALTTDTGETHSAALSTIGTSLAVLHGKVDVIHDTVKALAAEGP